MEERSLTLIRHATAAYRARTDFDRPLSKPGIWQAKELGQKIKEEGVEADLIIHSSATRAQMTAEQVSVSFPKARLIGEEKLYGCSPWEIFEFVQQYESLAEKGIFVVGHEPIISMTASILIQPEEEIGGVVSTATALVTDPIVELGRIQEAGAHFRQRIHVPVRD